LPWTLFPRKLSEFGGEIFIVRRLPGGCRAKPRLGVEKRFIGEGAAEAGAKEMVATQN
jgi:hypothetical protein